jgi:hypothetical protein
MFHRKRVKLAKLILQNKSKKKDRLKPRTSYPLANILIFFGQKAVIPVCQ